jgi:hypothetical protein
MFSVTLKKGGILSVLCFIFVKFTYFYPRHVLWGYKTSYKKEIQFGSSIPQLSRENNHYIPEVT